MSNIKVGMQYIWKKTSFHPPIVYEITAIQGNIVTVEWIGTNGKYLSIPSTIDSLERNIKKDKLIVLKTTP